MQTGRSYQMFYLRSIKFFVLLLSFVFLTEKFVSDLNPTLWCFEFQLNIALDSQYMHSLLKWYRRQQAPHDQIVCTNLSIQPLCVGASKRLATQRNDSNSDAGKPASSAVEILNSASRDFLSHFLRELIFLRSAACCYS